MDYFPFFGDAELPQLFPRDAPIRNFASELPFLHFARNVAYEFVHCHYVGGGVAAAGEGAWTGDCLS